MVDDLVVRAQAGDLDAFSALTSVRTNRLFAVARLILRDDEMAADAVQEALVQAWLDIRALRDPGRFAPWLDRLLVRECYRAARRHRSHRVLELRVSSTLETTSSDVQREVAARDQLDRGLRRLPADQRAAIVVRFYLDLPLAEAADVLGIPLGTMQSRLNRALHAMRAALEADDRPATLTEGVAR